MAKKWDTPTDGISRKKFDRAMDAHIRRYATAMEAIRDLEIRSKALELKVGFRRGPSTEEE